MRYQRTRPKRGFTLTELLVVITIIGLLMTFILIAAADGVRRAEEKATLGLITKLEMGLSERIEAILIRRADIYPAHDDIAAIYTSAGGRIPALISGVPIPTQRAQVIAQIDLFRSEIPDVFFVQQDARYPLNFAGLPYGGLPFVPLGSQLLNTARPVLGAYGATWQAASGIKKNLGYLPSGFDGVDNNGDGYIDTLSEGVGADPLVPDPDSPRNTIQLSALIARRLANHKHNTARSEMLYALLVEGQGPLGSVFTADEFTNREVADTDNDGLPEFIDAWGQPLQFYRQRRFIAELHPEGRAAIQQRLRATPDRSARPEPAAHGARVVLFHEPKLRRLHGHGELQCGRERVHDPFPYAP
jgi:prepilin-type N-terminal cleavage/methylation domain-containing protein